MRSLFDELTGKLEADPRLTKKGGPRVDLSLLLFNARNEVRALWLAAAEEVDATKRAGRLPSQSLLDAVEALRPVFGPSPR